MADWREELQRYLIAAGTNGKKQTDIVIRLQNWVTRDEVVAELEALLAEKKVQKFKPQTVGRGKAPTIWRATVLILEQ
jgi:hypothetical protein